VTAHVISAALSRDEGVGGSNLSCGTNKIKDLSYILICLASQFDLGSI
jgi:hypothetical protein